MIFLYFLLAYSIFILVYSIWLYSINVNFYKPIKFKNKEGKIVNAHDEYEEFSCRDEKVSFLRIYIGSFIFMPFRFFFQAITAFILALILNIFNKLGKQDVYPRRRYVENVTWFLTKIYILVGGVFIDEKKLEYENVYKKYLGDDYIPDMNDKDFSLYVCNHWGFYEILCCMMKFAPGFIAKIGIKSNPFIGPCAQALGCLFVDRSKKEERYKIFNELMERQKNFKNGITKSPLVVFPEGTTTSGRNIISFKKGAFFALMPIKPLIINVYQNSSFHLSCGVQVVPFNLLRSYTYLYHKIYYAELPVIRPTKFMYEKYKHLGQEKYQIYAEVVRRIYSEIGGFKLSDKNLDDLHIYEKICDKGDGQEYDSLKKEI